MHAPPSAADWIDHGSFLEVPERRRMFVRLSGAGAPTLFLHGFPTWSWDWHAVLARLDGLQAIAPDFLGFGASDKPRMRYTIAQQADAIESVIAQLGVREVRVVAHDYGTIVTQELLHRARCGRLSVSIPRVALLNGGIVFAAYRKTAMQKLLETPLLGALLAARLPQGRWRAGIQRVCGPRYRIGDEEWANLWAGIARAQGHKIMPRLAEYNAERKRRWPQWESALAEYSGALGLVWGMADPVSGAHVYERAVRAYPRARTLAALDNVGHWPQLEAPDAVAEALRDFLNRERSD